MADVRFGNKDVTLIDEGGNLVTVTGGKLDVNAAITGVATEIGQDPLAKYKIADEDSTLATKYYGFTSSTSSTKWMILRQVVGATTTEYRYANVSNNTSIAYGTATTGAWATRATLTYSLLYSLTGI